MATVIRPELSKKNKWYIDKHRYYELKHFCLQYPLWKWRYRQLCEPKYPVCAVEKLPSDILKSDPTATRAMLKEKYSRRIKMIEDTADCTDEALSVYILKAVTRGLSYVQLQTLYDIPCGRDMYYDRYRKFFWTLSSRMDDIY